MPFDAGQCTDKERIRIDMDHDPADGEFDSPPGWSVLSGNGSVVADADGMGAYLVSEDNVNGPADTRYHVEAVSGGNVVPGDNDLVLRVVPQTVQVQSFSFTASPPEPK